MKAIYELSEDDIKHALSKEFNCSEKDVYLFCEKEDVLCTSVYVVKATIKKD